MTAGSRTIGVDTHVHQAEAWCRILSVLVVPAIHEGTCCASRVHEELVHVFESIEAMCAAPAEDIDVKAVGLGQEQVWLIGDQREAL